MDKTKALEVGSKDLYFPKSTGVYNVELIDFEEGNLHQQWTYNNQDLTVRSRQFPTKSLFEGVNRNLIVYRRLPNKNQEFFFDNIAHRLSNVNTHNTVEAEKVNSSATTGHFAGLKKQEWEI